ncbi:S8 family serine peptidase [uncultured Shewanella sp.]|uniref:S8 family serine peptidase n=1 Tax=uncultured Shewanella sp. TaxID=173975 RepID=UPI002627DEBB|nr:S8 family serine peptidase [uncultured Shewanella sp.]
MKTRLAIAISAALLSPMSFAATEAQYNITHQNNDKYRGQKVSLQGQSQQKHAVAWMIKLNTKPIAQQSQTLDYDATSVKSQITASQARVLASLSQMNAKVLTSTSVLMNTLIVEADKPSLSTLYTHPDVQDILPIYDYKLNITDSADYINATKIVTSGLASGAGQRVAILDTGVDYTHQALGGTGTQADFDAAIASKAQAPSWPQGNIIGGWDFINNDPNPIEIETSHGTHVTHSVLGIAPETELFVYSVCQTICPGLAQILALEAAIDPNGDGNISDRVDTVNMSIGGIFGDTQDDAIQAMIDEVTQLGVNFVVAAGNDGASPFIVGGPSTTDSALSVAATSHPITTVSDIDLQVNDKNITAKAALFNPDKAFRLDNTQTVIIYPDANQTACDAFSEAIDFTGKTVLIDTGGECSFTDQVLHAQQAGAAAVIIGLHVRGMAPFSMSGSDNRITIPSIMIEKSDSDFLKEQIIEGNLTFSIEATEYNAVDSIASFTSRGPSVAGTLKPEITAPGVSVLTAQPGTGNALTPVSGTSFSSPITAGAVSLLRQALPDRNALEIKATLMNTANLNMTLGAKALEPEAELAPISYIGAGLLNVDKAMQSSVIAWSKDTKQAALAYGLVAIDSPTNITKTVRVKNFSTQEKNYTLHVNPRFNNDVDTEAVSFTLPESISIPAGQTVEFDVIVKVDPNQLPEWKLSSSFGLSDTEENASKALTLSEYDGSIEFKEGDEIALHLVYHMLPKAKAAIDIKTEISDEETKRVLTNTGATSINYPYAVPLLATSPIDESQRHDIINVTGELIDDYFCRSGIGIYSSMQTRDPIIHPLGNSYLVDFDTNQDGVWDYSVSTINIKDLDSRARHALYAVVGPYGSNSDLVLAPAYHMTGNDFLTLGICLEDLSLTEDALGQSVNVRYRIEEAAGIYAATGKADEVTATLTLNYSGLSAQLLDSEDNIITKLAPGQSAYLNTQGAQNALGYVLQSEAGAVALAIDTRSDPKLAPTINSAEFIISIDTAAGSLLGQLDITDLDELSSPFSEVIVLSSNSDFLIIDKEGTVRLSDDAIITEDTPNMIAEVIALDTLANRSGSATVTVIVQTEDDNDGEEKDEEEKDENEAVEEDEAVEEKAALNDKSSSAGSLGWLGFFLLPLTLLRRRH